jgi:hypothetical protein
MNYEKQSSPALHVLFDWAFDYDLAHERDFRDLDIDRLSKPVDD